MKRRATAVAGIFMGLTLVGLPMRGTAAPAAGFAPPPPSRELPPLQLVQRIPVPDVSGRIAMIDPATEVRVGKELKTAGGHAESFQLEKKGTRIFVNVPDDSDAVEVLDRKDGKLTKWSLNGAKANFPMALDEASHRLFVITRRPPLLIVLDTDTGKEVARLPTLAASDDVYFDAARKRIYVIGGAVFIPAFHQTDANHYQMKADISTNVGVLTGVFFGKNLYVRLTA